MMVQEQSAKPERKSARKMRERARQLGSLTEAQAALGWGVILIVLALLGAIYLNQTSSVATVGRRVQFLQGDLDELRRENAELERKIAEAQSLERLQVQAAQLGFIEARSQHIEYIVVPDYPVEVEETAVAAATPMPPPVETMQEALQLTFGRSITDFVRGESSEK